MKNFNTAYRHRITILIYCAGIGLPREHFILAKNDCMVKWNADTGEVSTVEYGQGSKTNYVWYDELAYIEKNQQFKDLWEGKWKSL